MPSAPLSGLLDSLAKWNVVGTYSRYAAFLDPLLYCALFIALTNAALSRRFPGRPGRVLGAVTGLALGIAFTMTAQSFGWSLRKAGPIAVLALITFIGSALLRTAFRTARSRKQYAIADDSGFIARLNRRGEQKQLKVERAIKRRMVPFAKHRTGRAKADLNSILSEVERKNPDWQAVSRELTAVATRGGQVFQAIERIRLLDQRLEKFDWRELRNLTAYYRELSDEDKAKLKEQITLERRKIVQEHIVLQLAKRCEERQRAIQQLLKEASSAASKQDRAVTSRTVSRVMALETEQKGDIKALQAVERKLLRLTKKKLRKESGSK